MFYEPAKNNHGLAYSPFKACVVPRPIGWISTISPQGVVNLAPFSEFNYLGYDPPYVMFCATARRDGTRKDSVINVEATGQFVFNMATWELREAVRITSEIEEAGVDEMKAAGLEPVASRLVKPPRVAASPVHFECLYQHTTVLPGTTPRTNNHMIVGKVIGVHIADGMIDADGRLDILKIRPLARLGYLDYATVESTFRIGHAGNDQDPRLLRAMSGTPPVPGGN